MLEEILDVLIAAVTLGAVEVLTVKRAGSLVAEYKDARELVTTADQRSDAAILAVFRERLPRIDPTIAFELEESGRFGGSSNKKAGADPLDGTNHFAAGGNLYSVQAHYVEKGIPLVGVVFQPEVYLPLEETVDCVGRLAFAIRGQGAFVRRSLFRGDAFDFAEARRLTRRNLPQTRTYVSCVPFSTKMTTAERERTKKVYDSGIMASTTGTGGAGGNVMMTILGGQHVYANFGAGEDLDLIPPQVIAEEAGLTVWGIDRRSPVWKVRKQPFVVAPTPEIAEEFFEAAEL
jgi:3'-phosphoadenosine 5'-phosphosulfate (PAPS) 3'-phosphatase